MQDDQIEDRRETPRADPERRSITRRRCVLSAYIFFPSDEHILPVRATNLSEAGAKLHLFGLRPLPDRFTLSVPQRLLAYECVVAWKNLPDLGVLFVGQPPMEMEERIKAALNQLR